MSTTTTRAIHNAHTYLFPTYAQPDIVLERGDGVSLYDTEGTRYLDFYGGIAVNALGYGDPEVAHTIAQHAATLIHTSNLYHTIPGGELARLLIEASPGFDRVFFCNSGAEAIEGAIKTARKFARDRSGDQKHTLVAFDGAFHGRTMGAVALTARQKYRQPFEPVMPGVRFAPFNDLAPLDAAITDDVCAVFVEPIQGEGGLAVATNEFLHRIRARCDHHGALLVVDEIQCGMGRTGTLWAHQAAGITPDIMVLAKPLAGGLPIGAILAREEVACTFAPGDHGTTFGGGPLVTSVARVVLDRIRQPSFLAHVNQVSNYLGEALADLVAQHPDFLCGVRGRGLMRGLHVRGSAAALRSAALRHQLLVATAGDDVIRLLPPLIIEPHHVDDAIQRLTHAIADAQEAPAFGPGEDRNNQTNK